MNVNDLRFLFGIQLRNQAGEARNGETGVPKEKERKEERENDWITAEMFEYAKSIWSLAWNGITIHHSCMDLKPLWASFMGPLATETDNRPTTVLILANDGFLLGSIST